VSSPRPPSRPAQSTSSGARRDAARARGRYRLRLLLAALVGIGVGVGAGYALTNTSSTATPPPRTAAASTHPAITATAAASTPATTPTTTTSTPAPPPIYTPRRLRSLIRNAPHGDGVWHRASRWAGNPPALLVTTLQFNPNDSTDTAYIAWVRGARTQLALYPGDKNPPSTNLPRGPMQVPPFARGRLVAAFNSGFYLNDAPGGFFVNGHLYSPMRAGLATVVQYRNGQLDITSWHGGRRPAANIVMARQNLDLFVDAGYVNPALDASQRWGSTLHGAPAVWRTGIGVDRHGNLLYVAAPNQTAPTLARLLVRAGAVRAMQLDINPAWPIFVTYAGAGAHNPSLFVPNPQQVPDRFLFTSTKDFFAVYLRTATTVANEPW
jgi:hypothetical protein